MSPRHVPASVTELSRVGLLAELPGDVLTRLAERMRREDVGPGVAVIREGSPGDRFFVLLSGVAGVTQADRGARRMIRPGEYFGEVSPATGVGRTATVTAMSPCVVASCDLETFEEIVLPLFQDAGDAA